ncbi:hypothetical protein D3C84_816280 [compost metagenome]
MRADAGRGRKAPGDIQHKHQPHQNQTHQRSGACGRSRATQRPGEQRQQDGKHVGHQQRQRHRDPCDGGVQTQALRGNQKAQQQLPAPGTRRQTQTLFLPQHQDGEHQQGPARTHQNRQQHTRAIIKSDPRRHMVTGERTAHAQQNDNGEMAGEGRRYGLCRAGHGGSRRVTGQFGDGVGFLLCCRTTRSICTVIG